MDCTLQLSQEVLLVHHHFRQAGPLPLPGMRTVRGSADQAGGMDAALTGLAQYLSMSPVRVRLGVEEYRRAAPAPALPPPQGEGVGMALLWEYQVGPAASWHRQQQGQQSMSALTHLRVATSPGWRLLASRRHSTLPTQSEGSPFSRQPAAAAATWPPSIASSHTLGLKDCRVCGQAATARMASRCCA